MLGWDREREPQMIRHGLSLVLAALAFCQPLRAAETETCNGHEDVTLAAEDGFFPYTGLFEGELRGLSRDIVAAAYHAVGCRVTFKVMPYSRCIREVARGRILGCFNTTNSRENQRKYLFHAEPLLRGRISIFAHPDAGPVFNPSNFKTHGFAVVRGYTYTDAFDQDPEVRKIEVETDLQTLALVSHKRTDYAVVYDRVAKFQMHYNRATIDPPPVPVYTLTDFDLFVSFSWSDAALSLERANLLDAGLRRIRADGTYAAIKQSWNHWIDVGVERGAPAPHWRAPGAR